MHSRPRAPGWIGCELIQRTTQTPLRSHLRSLDGIYRWFRLTGAETSIKTRRLSLNLSLAPRRRQPLQELFFSSLFSPLVSGCLRTEGKQRGLYLFCTWENNQVLVLHQLSVSDRSFCQARQEVRLLSLSRGPCHLGLLFYRCSIKGSQRNHPAFLWLKRFTSIPSRLLSSLDPPLTSERSAGVTGPGRSEGTVGLLSRYQNRFHAGTSPSPPSHHLEGAEAELLEGGYNQTRALAPETNAPPPQMMPPCLQLGVLINGKFQGEGG